MSSVTVNISFQDSLLAELDRLARRESRSRSELLREAARMYIERRERWDAIFALGRQAVTDKRLVPEDVTKEIAAHRQARTEPR